MAPGVGEDGENGTAKRAAVAIEPEFGTVGPELIREAAKEAVKFADLLVVCGGAASSAITLPGVGTTWEPFSPRP